MDLQTPRRLIRPALTWQDRIDNYNTSTGFPNSLFVAGDGRVIGVWIMGNDYRVKSQYYGGYPNTYLRRVKSLFPDKQCVLHLFSGKVDTSIIPGDTVDIRPELNPTFVDDAQTLEKVPLELYDCIMCDPPYSVEDAERYQTSMIKRSLVMRALQRCKVGTHVIWIDQVWPQYRKDFFELQACVGIQRSTNHRVRMMWIWERKNG